MVKKDSLDSIKALLIAIIAIALIFIALFAYSGIWPPIVIVESSSMQHGDQWQYGVINTGDIVLVKKVTSVSNIITYVQGRETGYKSYGDYGNVIIYTSQSGMSVIHRAIFYVTWNNAVPEITGENKASSFMKILGDYVIIEDMGFSHRNLLVDLGPFIGQSGFVTMGDNNLANLPLLNFQGYIVCEAADENVGISSSLVNMHMIEGIAQGWLPWFGDIKLIVTGNTEYIPSDSYYYLAISLIILFSIPGIYDITAGYIKKKKELKK